MSEELRRKLQFLEEDYPNQPPAAQKADLLEINQIRSQLGMPAVDEHLNEAGAVIEVAPVQVTPPEPEPVPDYTEARAMYDAYLERKAVLQAHQDYADEVTSATAGHGQTRVRPLATMGTNGGPLLCDHCGKPIVLEGGPYHGVTADVAWRRNPNPSENWTSWILGGMVVEIQTNGTLRIYHGYPGRGSNHCCNAAAIADDKARAAYDSSQRSKKKDMMWEFIEQELTDLTEQEQLDLLNDVLEVMCTYDPGLGINHPTSSS